jgi:hypothetical protein
MRILFAIGTAVSALLLTSCTNPDTSGGVTMQKADESLPLLWTLTSHSVNRFSHFTGRSISFKPCRFLW